MNRLTRRLAAVAAAGAALVVAPAAMASGDKIELSVVSSPAAVRLGRRRADRDRGTRRNVVRRGRRDAERRRRPLRLRAGSRREPPARRRPDRPAARREPADREGREGQFASRQAQARQQPDPGPDLLRPAPGAVRLRDDEQRRPGWGCRRSRSRRPARRRPSCRTSIARPRTRTTWLPYDPASPPPASAIVQTTTMDGLTVPMIVRWERGVINRFMYSILVLSPFSQTSTLDLSAWNRKALFSFSGGVAIGHTQGAAERRRHALPRPACRWATPSSTRPARARTRTTTSSSAARRRSCSRTTSSRSTRSPSTRSLSAAPAARSSSTSTGRTIPG